MTPRSLRFRLLAAAVVSVAVALLIAGISLAAMFQHHVERRAGFELDTYLNQIVAGIDVNSDGRVSFDQELADPRFEQPLSGLYWQIQDDSRPTLLRSRSLWDVTIPLPVDILTSGIVHQHSLSGPADRKLMVRERQILFRSAASERRLRIAVAVDEQDLVEARNAFAVDMLPYLLVMAAVLLTATWIQVGIGLKPLDAVRRGVMSIRSGKAPRLERGFPHEVMSLVEEMNGLLEAQELSMKRARAWTADLAHGLKTPLMVLTADSQRLREEGNTAIAEDLDHLAETMRRRVDRELIRARIRSGIQTRPARTDAPEVVRGIVRALQRTPLGANLEWLLEICDNAPAAIAADDLAELLGNILENATKWAGTAIRITLARGETVAIEVEDDGPGVPEGQLDSLGMRGHRLDQQKQGTGLGLAIAGDIAEAYSGQLAFTQSRMGGLAVQVRLPAAP